MPRQVWKCPKCCRSIGAVATQVGHRCTAHRLKWVDWQPVDGNPEVAM
jgi:hypothetical protein